MHCSDDALSNPNHYVSVGGGVSSAGQGFTGTPLKNILP